MKYFASVCLLFLLSFSFVQAQFPPLEMNMDVVTVPGGSVADVSLRAGQNWQNITTIRGTIQFDTTVIEYSTMSYWGLSNPGGATFTYQGGGILTYTWNSLITIGPTLSAGDIVFTLQFNAIGATGSMSPVNLVSSPQVLYWANGFGWSGNNFTSSNGQVNISCGTPPVNFSAADSLFSVQFTDMSAPTVTSYFWDFGDGNTSTQQNPNHTYASGGSYLVCLTVSDSCGTDSTCQTVSVCNAPVASFSSQGNQLAYAFSDLSTGNATSWFWDFGDGNTSTQQNPNHTYAQSGIYTICQTVSSACGSDSSCSSVTVTCAAPQVAFSDSTVGLTGYFADLSANMATSWLWDFGDGNTSTQQNPNHTYAAPGGYAVCLVVSNACGSDSTCSPVVVSCTAPTAIFADSSIGATVSFFDLSTDSPTSWFWDFGDGNTSTQQNPSHTYTANGAFTVCLVATSLCGSDSTCSSVSIVTAAVDPSEAATLMVYPNPSKGSFWIEFPTLHNPSEVQVFNSLGKLVYSQPVESGGKNQVDLREQPGGAYWIRVEGHRIARVLVW